MQRKRKCSAHSSLVGKCVPRHPIRMQTARPGMAQGPACSLRERADSHAMRNRIRASAGIWRKSPVKPGNPRRRQWLQFTGFEEDGAPVLNGQPRAPGSQSTPPRRVGRFKIFQEMASIYRSETPCPDLNLNGRGVRGAWRAWAPPWRRAWRHGRCRPVQGDFGASLQYNDGSPGQGGSCYGPVPYQRNRLQPGASLAAARTKPRFAAPRPAPPGVSRE